MNKPANPFVKADGTKPTCMEMLQAILDGEATSEQRHYFQGHMGNCPPCFKSYDLDMAIRELLKTKCSGGDVPIDLIDKIRTQISLNAPS